MLREDHVMHERVDQYDVIVIGAGAAGRSAALTAASFGARVAIVDNSPTSGVMPLEAIAGLKLRELIRQQRGALAGFDAWRNKIICEAHEHAMHAQQVLREQIAIDFLQHGVAYIEGAAVLGMKHNIQVALRSGDSKTYTGYGMVIATGALPIPPQGMPPDDPSVRNCQDFLFDEPLEEGLLITGAGNRAITLASLMAALDVPVTMVLAGDRIAPEMDEEHAALLQHDLIQAGVRIHFGIGKCLVERVHGRLRAELDDGTVLHPATVRYTPDLLPNTSGIGLQKAGVQVNEAGFIKVDSFFRTTAHNIYAVGDVIGPSSNDNATFQGRAAACHIYWRALKEYVDPMPVRHVSGIPEMASAGLSEAECRAQQIDCIIGRSRIDRTLCGLVSSQHGQLKLIFDQSTRQLIGVHCIGNNAVDIVTMGQAVMHYGGTLEAFDAIIPVETSYALAYRDAMRDAQKALR